LVLSELAGIGAVPAWRAKQASVQEALSSGGVADDNRRGHRPAARLRQQGRAVALNKCGEFVEQFAFLTRDLTAPGHQRLGDAQLRRMVQAPELSAEPSEVPGVLDGRGA
jgi:hypothetical protein